MRFFFITAICIIFVSTQADCNEKLEKKIKQLPENSWISNGKSIGFWWLKSSKCFDPMPSQLLYHIVGSYSYMNLDGNVNMDSHRGGLRIVLRKSVITSSTIFNVSKNEISISVTPDETTKVEEYNFVEITAVDITKLISIEGGMYWTTDTKKYIKDRYTYFGGIRFNIFQSSDLSMSLGFYYGYEDTSFMNDEIQESNPDANIIEPYASDGVSVIQDLNWKINERVNIWEKFDSVQHFEKWDYYRWTLDMGIDISIISGISVFASYNITYENNIFIESGKQFGMEERDITTSFGIRITL